MKYLLILGYTFALIFHTNSALSQSIDKAVDKIQKLESIESPPQKSANRIAITHSIDSQRELYRLCKAAQTGNGNTIYYSNGKVMTDWAGRKNATWYYPNGQIMTAWAGKENATWYHPNGQIMTDSGNLISKQEMLYPCSYIE